MPVWRIFHHPTAFTAEQKRSFANDVTRLYADKGRLPEFYVNVLFIPLEEDGFYIGGQARKDFVRIVIEQIARTMPGPDTEEGKSFRKRWMDAINATVAPYVKDRGLEWENHIYETPFDLWRVNGLSVPPANSEAEALWRKENKALPWEKSAL